MNFQRITSGSSIKKLATVAGILESIPISLLASTWHSAQKTRISNAPEKYRPTT